MLWLDRQVSTIESHSGPIVINSGYDDTAVIFAALRKKYDSVIWLELTDKEKNDSVALGNLLSDAVEQGLGDKLFAYGMPYSYGLRNIESQLGLLGPLYFLISRAEKNLDFVLDLFKLNKQGSKVICSIVSEHIANDLARSAYIISRKDLLLSREEAADIASGYGQYDYLPVWEESSGNMLDFLEKTQSVSGLPELIIPSPSGARLRESNSQDVDPEILLKLLVKKEKWIEVLELAVSLNPFMVPEIITKAGYRYNELGQNKRLWELLSELPKEVKRHEDVMFWLLSSAFWQGKAEVLREDVEEYLNNNEAAELRALYAGVLASPDRRLVEAKRAYEAKKSSNTAYMLGNFEPDYSERQKLLYAAMKHAENSNRDYELVRNATGQIKNLVHLGRYKEAQHWSEWASERMAVLGIKNDYLRLWLLSYSSYLAIILGERTNIYNSLSKEVRNLSGVIPFLAIALRENLADYFLSIGNNEAALRMYYENWNTGHREYLGRFAYNLVKVYLANSEHENALKIISQAKTILHGAHPLQEDYLDVAYASTMIMVDSKKGVGLLLNILDKSDFENWQSSLKIHSIIYLVWGYLELAEIEKAKNVLLEHSQLSIAKNQVLVLGGPSEMFEKVLPLLGGKRAELELNFLRTKSECWYLNKKIKFSLREKEIITLLISNPRGVILNQLGAMLNQSTEDLRNLKTAVTRLRKKIPISKDIYKISASYSADFAEVPKLIRKAKLRKVLDIYREPLLPESNSLAIEELRAVLDQTIRQAALHSNDADAVFEFAERSEDDLDVWEHLLNILPKGDSRIPYTKAKIFQLKKDLSES